MFTFYIDFILVFSSEVLFETDFLEEVLLIDAYLVWFLASLGVLRADSIFKLEFSSLISLRDNYPYLYLNLFLLKFSLRGYSFSMDSLFCFLLMFGWNSFWYTDLILRFLLYFLSVLWGFVWETIRFRFADLNP